MYKQRFPKHRVPVSVNWSTDISAMPRGKTSPSSNTKNGVKLLSERWSPAYLWAVCEGIHMGKHQMYVTATHWQPSPGKWAGFAKNETPRFLAWAPAKFLSENDLKPVLPDIDFYGTGNNQQNIEARNA